MNKTDLKALIGPAFVMLAFILTAWLLYPVIEHASQHVPTKPAPYTPCPDTTGLSDAPSCRPAYPTQTTPLRYAAQQTTEQILVPESTLRYCMQHVQIAVASYDYLKWLPTAEVSRRLEHFRIKNKIGKGASVETELAYTILQAVQYSLITGVPKQQMAKELFDVCVSTQVEVQ